MAPIAHTCSGLRLVALLSAALLAMVLPQAAAQLTFLGKCPEMDVVENFNVFAYLGKWYEQERYFTIFELGGKCVTATYTDEGDGKVGVNNEMTYRLFGLRNGINGTATLVGDNGEGKLEVRFSSVGNFPAPYWILYTDYTDYAIVWSCTSVLEVINLQFAWVLTRERHPSENVMATVKEALKMSHLEERYFIKTSQDCEDN